MIRFSTRLLVFTVVLLGFLECFFRIGLPSDRRPVYRQDPDSRLLFFDNELVSSGVHRYGNPPVRGGTWSINEAGWISMFEYLPEEDRDRDLIALYGDSYVVGLNTEMIFHQDALISDSLEQYDVYSFAMGGMMLMEYVKLIEYAEETYNPSVHVIYLNSNDLRHSIANFAKYTLYYQLEFSGDSIKVIVPRVFSESTERRVMRRSALLSYLRYNRSFTGFGSGRGRVDPNANNIEAEVITEFEEESPVLYMAAEFMLNEICQQVNGDLVLLVCDGPRGPVYRLEEGITPFQDCEVISAVSRGYSNVFSLNLLEVYQEKFAENHTRFNDLNNSHWNSYGNQVVAGAVARSIDSILTDSI